MTLDRIKEEFTIMLKFRKILKWVLIYIAFDVIVSILILTYAVSYMTSV